jgi:hypothetical protein
MAAGQPGCWLLYRQPGSLPPEFLVFPADVLADVEGKAGSVTLETTAVGQGEARWDDGGVPRNRPFETVVPEGLPELPKIPKHMAALEPAFLNALAEAARTTARDGVRYALTRLQLRGPTGQLVATDGRQLLVQGGFSLPWSEDVLIPTLPLFVSPDLPSEGPLSIGRTASHVGLQIGPWTFHLEIDADGRYPDASTVIPRTETMVSRLSLAEEDAGFPRHVLPRLPGDKDQWSPVTLDLGQQVVLRARGDDSPQVSEVLLSGSSCAGQAVRVACNRRFLWRLVQLRFREVLVRNATTPLLCRDETRTYLFMPLDNALPPAADAVRIVSGESNSVALRTQPKPEPPRRRAVMPRPQSNGRGAAQRPCGSSRVAPTYHRGGAAGPADGSRSVAWPVARCPIAARPAAVSAQAAAATQPCPSCCSGFAAPAAPRPLSPLDP